MVIVFLNAGFKVDKNTNVKSSYLPGKLRDHLLFKVFVEFGQIIQ